MGVWILRSWRRVEVEFVPVPAVLVASESCSVGFSHKLVVVVVVIVQWSCVVVIVVKVGVFVIVVVAVVVAIVVVVVCGLRKNGAQGVKTERLLGWGRRRGIIVEFTRRRRLARCSCQGCLVYCDIADFLRGISVALRLLAAGLICCWLRRIAKRRVCCRLQIK